MMKAIQVMALTLLLAVSAAAAEDVTTVNRPDDVHSVIRVVERFTQAWNLDDISSFLSLFAPNGELITPKGTSKTPSDIQHVLVNEHPEIFFGTNLSEVVKSIGFPAARRAEVKGRYLLCCVEVLLGFEASSDGLFMLELIDQDGEWKIERASITGS